MTERPGRRGYLDWMRGLAVVIMVFWHTLDAWTTPVDKASGASGIPAHRRLRRPDLPLSSPASRSPSPPAPMLREAGRPG
jgi:hypothetical protein